MGENSKIEWTDATWNPVRGCSRHSPGCQNCYAEIMAARFSGSGQWGEGFATIVRDADGKALDHRWTGKVAVHWPAIDLPLSWRQPRRIFVNSTSDLFHASLSDADLATIYAVAISAHHLRGHTFQILTKRADRMRATLSSTAFWDQVNAEVNGHVLDNTDPLNRTSTDARATCADDYGPNKPPPGIWLGVSVEDQPRADERIPDLLHTPAALRFLSCEPLLGPVSLHPEADKTYQMLSNWYGPEGFDPTGSQPTVTRRLDLFPRIDWVICGGESGPGSRPMHPDWARSLRDQCVAAGVPFFFKQWGEYAVDYDRDRDDPDWRKCGLQEMAPGRWINLEGGTGFHGERVHYARKVGKKAAGRMLDGRTHDQVPGGVA